MNSIGMDPGYLQMLYMQQQAQLQSQSLLNQQAAMGLYPASQYQSALSQNAAQSATDERLLVLLTEE